MGKKAHVDLIAATFKEFYSLRDSFNEFTASLNQKMKSNANWLICKNFRAELINTNGFWSYIDK